MHPYVLFFEQIERSSLSVVGGKGANLGELSKAGFPVPAGFCVTTQAYQDLLATSSEIDTMLESLYALDSSELLNIRKQGASIRTHIEQLEIPKTIANAIVHAWKSIGFSDAYAIRSSATAEDLPTASFAGQQDTYLNIKGKNELLEHIRKCWASLFTERAIAYRIKMDLIIVTSIYLLLFKKWCSQKCQESCLQPIR